MKPYQQVLAERYEGREKQIHVYADRYALVNPIGFYMSAQIRKAFYTAFNRLRQTGLDISSQRILDAGCGFGEYTRYFAELRRSPAGVAGTDLSAYRIETARELNPAIHYTVGDLAEAALGGQYDIITAITVLMHLNTHEQITRALTNINRALRPGGFFMWFETLEKGHACAPEYAESFGFSRREMVAYGGRCGLAARFSVGVFRKLLWRQHTAYLCGKLPIWLVSLLEAVVPGPPGNILVVFEKTAEAGPAT